MNLLDSLISVLAPHICLGCGTEGRLLCRDCQAKLPPLPERCYRCRRLMSGWRTCASCRSSSNLYVVQVRSTYEGTAKTLVWQLKFQAAQSAARDIAACLAPLLITTNQLIVPVPTATRRARQRGYDQAKLIAQALASQTGMDYADCLRRQGQAHQVGASRAVRLRQLTGNFRVVQPLAGQQILLVDDVVTTGATLEAAAAVCRGAGARRVSAIVFAQP